MDLGRLAERLSRDFGPPFLAEGIVEVRVLERESGPHLMLRIGPRDVIFNAEGEVTDAGTDLCSRLILERVEPQSEVPQPCPMPSTILGDFDEPRDDDIISLADEGPGQTDL